MEDIQRSYRVCYETGKNCYTRAECGKILNSIKNNYVHKRHTNRSVIPKRCYYCKECQSWHLTSKRTWSNGK